jgi:hypothetical protein
MFHVRPCIACHAWNERVNLLIFHPEGDLDRLLYDRIIIAYQRNDCAATARHSRLTVIDHASTTGMIIIFKPAITCVTHQHVGESAHLIAVVLDYQLECL